MRVHFAKPLTPMFYVLYCAFTNKVTQHSSNPMNRQLCQAVIASGGNAGQPCRYAAKGGTPYCGMHAALNRQTTPVTMAEPEGRSYATRTPVGAKVAPPPTAVLNDSPKHPVWQQDELCLDVYLLSAAVQAKMGDAYIMEHDGNFIVFREKGDEDKLVCVWFCRSALVGSKPQWFVVLKPTALQRMGAFLNGVPGSFVARQDLTGGDESTHGYEVLLDQKNIAESATTMANLILESQAEEEVAAWAVFRGLSKIRRSTNRLLPIHMMGSKEAILVALRPAPQWREDAVFALSTKGEVEVFSSMGDCAKELQTVAADSLRAIVYPGVSGQGKSFAAVTWSEDQLRSLCGQEWSEAPVIGYYHNMRDMSEPKTFEGVSQAVAEGFRDLFDSHCSFPGTFGRVVLHLVVDEVGPHEELVRAVIVEATCEEGCGDDDTSTVSIMKKTIVKCLRGWYRDKSNRPKGAVPLADVALVVSLVGTGVDHSNSTEEALPPNYLTFALLEGDGLALPVRLFMGAMNRVLEAADVKAPADMYSRILSDDSLLSAMVTNARCALFAGEEAGLLLRSYLKYDDKDADKVARYLHVNAESIATRVSLEYIKTDAWGKLSTSEFDELASFLLSLNVTQPFGFHVVPDDVLQKLCCEVGAVRDTLKWGTEIQAFKGAAGNPILDRALRAKAFPCVPPPTPNGDVPRIGLIRFVIPPAVVTAVLLVAVSRRFDSGIFGGLTELPSTTYENVASTIIWCMFDALRRHQLSLESTPEEGFVKVPALLAFPSLAEHFPMTAKGKEAIRFKWRVSPTAQIKLRLPAIGRSTFARVKEVVDDMTGSCGVVLSMAGEGCAQNDLSIHNYGVRMGIEFKSYMGESSVKLDVLQKRAVHMGYDAVRLSAPLMEGDVVDDGGMFRYSFPDYNNNGLPATHTQRSSITMDIEVAKKTSGNLAGRFATLQTERLIRQSFGAELETGSTEFMVLCGPSDTPLLPRQLSCEFAGRKEASSGSKQDWVAERELDMTCEVLCLQLGVSEFIQRSSEIPPSETKQPTLSPSVVVGEVFSDRHGAIAMRGGSDYKLTFNKTLQRITKQYRK